MKAIITGSTGMLGKGVLLECIDDPSLEQVLLINRKHLDISHPKVKEVIHKDFRDFTSIKGQLEGYDACFHCMGVSSAGMSEEKFTEITYTMSKALATVLYSINPNMVFNYVSGAGTDSTEKSSTMWSRVKGKTENMILNMGFKDAYMFRPGAILPERGTKSNTKLYHMLYVVTRPLFPLMRRMKSVTTTTRIGRAMINLYDHPQSLKHLEGADINKVADIK
ncbi:NAD-dependent epimerase/dehydratase family protein [Maribacter luteus]|uniref:Epimerase n=1 Tax=Maribacter luteus TaxID=2594478 RepID=A0A6I2MQC9_9FLAO|nr:NAD-dependent epimerase/dehydratase family protein [Maribacter luteus]MRX64735.1 epimerase [Maribacter luteus]